MTTLTPPSLSFVILDAGEVSVEQAALPGHTVTCLSAKCRDHSDIAQAQLIDADVIGVWHTVDLDERFFQEKAGPKVALIVRFGAGYCNIDLEAARRREIVVCNVPSYGTEEVASATLSHILQLYTQTARLSAALAQGRVIKGPDAIAAAANEMGGAPTSAGGGKTASCCRRIRGEVLGIIGLGRIGSAVALRAKPFGWRIIAYDPFLAPGWEKAIGIDERCSSLAELLAKSDCVTIHANSTKENRHMLSTREFSLMKPCAFVVNTARGELIDEEALRHALETGQICAASLDVHEEEPFDQSGHKLSGCPNLVCTPHCAWYSRESRVEMKMTGAGYVASLAQQVADGRKKGEFQFLAKVN